MGWVAVWVILVVASVCGKAMEGVAAPSLSSSDYREALGKAILFFEGQRSGRLPPAQRVKWRGDSALSDGNLDNVSLMGGYYDAGDNVKFVWPMAFSVSLLSWAALDYEFEISLAKQLGHLRSAIRWGANFILHAHTSPMLFYTQVDYILGINPLGYSYMVGFGTKYPLHLHHRGASIPSIKVLPAKVGCGEGFSTWFSTNNGNPNAHVGAIVGGPNSNDQFNDVRSDSTHLEPTTYLNAAFVGASAALVNEQACLLRPENNATTSGTFII